VRAESSTVNGIAEGLCMEGLPMITL